MNLFKTLVDLTLIIKYQFIYKCMKTQNASKTHFSNLNLNNFKQEIFSTAEN